MNKNDYSIGQALKSVRKELGLTQKQMVGNIVSSAYYSKVENEKAEIDANTLFQILDLHNYDINKFYERIVSNNSINRSAFWYFESKFVGTANSRNEQELEKVEQEFKEIENSSIEGLDTLKVLLAVSEVMVKGTNQGVSKDIKNLAKKLIRGRDGKSYVYILLQSSMMLFNIDEGYALMTEAIKFFKQNKDYKNNEDTLHIATAAANYVKICWEKKADKKYAAPMIDFVKNLPIDSMYIGIQLIVDYYEALFNHEDKKVETIKQIFKDSGVYSVIDDNDE